MSATPPIAPENRLAPITTRVHRMRVARGACWVIVAMLLAGALLAVLDAVAWLPAWARGIGLAAWVTGIGVLVWRLVARRLPSDPTTSFLHARTELPGNLRAAATAALTLAASLAAATLLPGAGEHLRRVALPWSGSAGPLHYRVKITSGEPVVRRGDSVTLSAYAEKLNHAAETPDAATLICRDAIGTEWRIAMGGDGNGAFHATCAGVVSSFEYRVEIGHATSDWYPVSVLDPVELTGQSTIDITPPRYAPGGGKQVISGFVSFEAHQYSTATFRLRFSRPTAAAFLEWRADGGAPLELIPIVPAPDRLTGTAAFRLNRDGTLALVLVAQENGKSLRTVSPVRVHVKPDAPPRFERLLGITTDPRSARPGTRVGVEFTALDDLAIGTAVLEYVIGPDESKVVHLPVALSGAGSPRAEGRLDFELPSEARAGDTIRFRLRISDTRRLDEPDLSPQETRFPETGWSVIRIDPNAPPLDEQDILAQRNALGDALLGALQELKNAQNDIGQLRKDSADRTRLPLDQAVRLTNARDTTRTLAGNLRKAARDAALTPELRRLAEAVREIADQTLPNTDALLQSSSTDNPLDRKAALTAALERLGEAIERLDRHLTLNNRIAQARLDHKAIASIAAEQAAIATLARLEGPARPEEIARLQRDLFARLQTLIAQSDPLRTAAAIAKETEIRRLAAVSRELAGWLRDLDAAVRQLNLQARQELLRRCAKEQESIVARATALIAKTETAARLAGINLPTSAQFLRVVELIEAGKTVEALTELETRAEGLDAIAAALEKWVANRRDPKIAARQLGLWQDDLRTRFRAATKDKAINFDTLPPTTKAAFRHEQQAIQQTVLDMTLPPGKQLGELQNELLQHVSRAANLLDLTGTGAEVAMKTVVDDFNRLADAIPAIPERLAKARKEFLNLHQTQETILFSVEQAIRANEAAKRFPALVDREADLLRMFRALDIPGSEARRSRIRAALTAATADLRNGLASDALASQQWVKREFDRLKLVLDGLTAPDDKADELARKLDALARTVAALGPHATQKQIEAPAAEAQELARQIIQLGIPLEAPALANEARIAALALEAAGRAAMQKPDELRKCLPAAAEVMAKLTDRLTSAESDLDRVRRLAASRRAAWEEGKQNRGKPPSADVSAEASRQLVREADELAFTRVGFAGQSLKKRILDQYTRLKDQTNPDQMVGLQKALAESLDELAALMADIAELAAPFNRVPAAPTASNADNYLPTPALAATFRDLANHQRALRHGISTVPIEVVKLTKPSAANPLGDWEHQQRELAAAILDYARKLTAENETTLAESILRAAADARRAADQLAVGMLPAADEAADRAGQLLRQVATAGGAKPRAKTAGDLAARLDLLRAVRNVWQTPLTVIAAQQKARGEALTRSAGELARDLEQAARAIGPQEPAGLTLSEAAKDALAIKKLIAEATGQAAEGMSGEAHNLRREAIRRLIVRAETIATLAPMPSENPGLDPAAVQSAAALLRAEAAMRRALDALEPKADRPVVQKLMRSAADELITAAKARMDGTGK